MISREKSIIYTARVVSLIFTPFYLPLVGLVIMFLFSYMNLLPWEYRLMVLTLVYFFTMLAVLSTSSLLTRRGVYFQINALSLGGFYGEEAKHKAYEMLDAGWVEFMGTDTHNTMYAQALTELSNDRKVMKVLEKHEFLNKTL